MSAEPANIVPFAPPPATGRLYILKPPAPAKKGRRKPLQRSKPAKPDSGHAAASTLYRRFVRPHHPADPHKSNLAKFLQHSIPLLIHAMCPSAVHAVAMMHYYRHKNVWTETPVEFRRKLRHAINNASLEAVQCLQKPALALYNALRLQKHREAMNIVLSLARHGNGQFFIAARDLQTRLFLPNHMSALRCLQKLVTIGLIELVSKGTTAWEARQNGSARRATVYRITSEYLKSVPQSTTSVQYL